MGDLLKLLGPRSAGAEVVPQNAAAADLLNQSMAAYGDVIRAAQADPRKVNVFVDPRLRDTNVAGFYQNKPGYAGAGIQLALPNSLEVGPPPDPTQKGWNMKWLGEPVSTQADPQGLQQQTLAHELTHFLNQGKPIDTEFNADLTAANPDAESLLAIQRMKGGIGSEEMWRRAVLSALGQYSPLFIGPRTEQKPLVFKYVEPKKKKAK